MSREDPRAVERPAEGGRREHEPRPAEGGREHGIPPHAEEASADQRLARSEARYRALFENHPGYVAFVNRDRSFISANRLSAGGTMEALRRMRVDDYVAPESRHVMIAALEQAFASGQPSNYETDALLPDGSRRRFAVRVVPLLGEDGREQAMLITTDVTDAREARKSLVLNEERLDRATHAAGVSLWEWRPGQDRMDLDRTWATLVGLPEVPTSATRELWESRIAPEDRNNVRSCIDAYVAAPDSTLELEYSVTDQHGARRYLLTRGRAVEFDADGRATRIVGTHLDITARRVTELERTELATQLAHAQRLEIIGQLAGGVAHDFNNLLLAISGHTEIALMQLDQREAVRECLETILTATGRAADLTRRLLTVARRQSIELKPVDLGALVEEAIRLLERTLPETIRIGFHGEDGPWWVDGDAVQLQQVFMNLAINARDAMPAGGELTFHLSRKRAAGGRETVRIAVRDTGTGIPEELRGRVFEPFFTTKGAGFGTGLGLAVVSGTVRQHGGDVTVESGPGGTVFHVELPSANPNAAPSTRPPRSIPVHTRAVVLLAEDDRIVRDLTERVLRSSGYHVVSARDGASAIALIDTYRDRISVAVLDAVMPDGSGTEVYTHLCRVTPDVAVLFTSGYDAGVLPRDVVPNARVAVLPKPYGIHDLLNRVAELSAAREAARTET